MPLSDDLKQLRNRIFWELDAAHDYYAETKIAWLTVSRAVSRGVRIKALNNATGTTVTGKELAAKASGYIAVELAEATFQQFLSIFENFIFELIRLWLTDYPQSLGEKKFDLTFKNVLESVDKETIVSLFIERELFSLAYGPPKSWFKYLNDKVNLACPSTEEIDRFTEAKASRDVLAHNRGIANRLYEQRAGVFARHKPGERIEIPEFYHRDVWKLLRKMTDDICESAIAKA